MLTMRLNNKMVESETYMALGLLESDQGISTTPRVLSLISSALERSIRKNEKVSKKKEVVSIFNGSKAPALSIGRYLERIFKYSSCSPSCYVVAYVYIDRYLHKTGAYLTILNVHRLLITSIMAAAKFLDDKCYDNAYYAKVGGISNAEINKLEMRFLFTIDFRLHVTKEVFMKYCVQLEGEGNGEFSMIQYYGSKRVWQNKNETAIAGYSCIQM